MPLLEKRDSIGVHDPSCCDGTMKIAYFIHWDTSIESGVLRKIKNQLEAWQLLGHQVKLFALSPSEQVWSRLDHISVEVVAGSRTGRFYKSGKIYKLIDDWKPDLVYARFFIYYPFFDKLVRHYPIFFEINTNDIEEYKLTNPTYLYLYHRLTRSHILKIAAGLVFVTHELANYHLNQHANKLVVANGIDLSNYPQLSAPNNSRPRLIFLGKPRQAWHGIDQVLWLAKSCPDWHFDLIGPSVSDMKELPGNVTVHGYLNKASYEKIVSQADVAIGTLSLHLNRMHEACPLKVREYLAYGIPTIIGYQDTDFPNKVPFLLQLPSRPDNVRANLSEIKRFVNEWRGKRVRRDLVTGLDVKVKEEIRLNFLRDISSNI